MAKSLSAYIKYIIVGGGILLILIIIGVSLAVGNSSPSDSTFSSDSLQQFEDLDLTFENSQSCGYYSCATNSDFEEGSVINGYVTGVLDYDTIVFQAIDGNQYAVTLAGVEVDLSQSEDVVNYEQILFGANNSISISLDGPIINDSQEYVGWVKINTDNDEGFLLQTALNEAGYIIGDDDSYNWSMNY